MNSMTGYGKATVSADNREITIEMKSVNHRYLDINIKSPKLFLFADDIIRKEIQDKLMRGRIDVFVSYVDNRQKQAQIDIDMNLAQGYVAASKKLRTQFLIDNDFNVNALMRMPDVLKIQSDENADEVLKDVVKKCAADACSQMCLMRASEGEAIKKDISARIVEIADKLALIRKQAPAVVEQYRATLQKRITEALDKIDIDQSRLLNEVCFFADKANIDEEITRIDSHINGFAKILNGGGEAGKKLDFLSQELNREVNTICSKSNDVVLTQICLDIKFELEKIREQIQNLQ